MQGNTARRPHSSTSDKSMGISLDDAPHSSYSQRPERLSRIPVHSKLYGPSLCGDKSANMHVAQLWPTPTHHVGTVKPLITHSPYFAHSLGTRRSRLVRTK